MLIVAYRGRVALGRLWTLRHGSTTTQLNQPRSEIFSRRRGGEVSSPFDRFVNTVRVDSCSVGWPADRRPPYPFGLCVGTLVSSSLAQSIRHGRPVGESGLPLGPSLTGWPPVSRSNSRVRFPPVSCRPRRTHRARDDFHGSGQSSILTVDVRASQGVNHYKPPFTQTLRQ